VRLARGLSVGEALPFGDVFLLRKGRTTRKTPARGWFIDKSIRICLVSIQQGLPVAIITGFSRACRF
jgi:hypothetical protein